MRKRSRKGTSVPKSGSRTEPKYELTDEQWQLIADLFPHKKPSRKGGRPGADPRACFEGILWILRTGAPWKDLPSRFPSPTTCWRRLNEWTQAGLWEKAWGRLVRKLDRQGKVHRDESFADGTFSPAKKGANSLAKRNAVREPRSWSSRMVTDFPWVSTLPARVRTKSL